MRLTGRHGWPVLLTGRHCWPVLLLLALLTAASMLALQSHSQSRRRSEHRQLQRRQPGARANRASDSPPSYGARDERQDAGELAAAQQAAAARQAASSQLPMAAWSEADVATAPWSLERAHTARVVPHLCFYYGYAHIDTTWNAWGLIEPMLRGAGFAAPGPAPHHAVGLPAVLVVPNYWRADAEDWRKW